MQACDHIHNKYFNWLALNMIQQINTRLSLKQGTGNRGWEWERGMETGICGEASRNLRGMTGESSGNLREMTGKTAGNDRGICGESVFWYNST